MTEAKMRRRVERGAAWMDKKHPGWFRKLDVSRLDAHSDDRCVIGQVTGSFTATQPWFRSIPFSSWANLLWPPSWIALVWASRTGFALLNFAYEDMWRRLWKEQADQRIRAWKREIVTHRINVSPIIVGPDGRIIDGHHRYEALVRSGR
jgi:hypothetical protein